MTRPSDHDERLRRALLALDGLSIGDAFGERFFNIPTKVRSLIAGRVSPRAPWLLYTDDTTMALSVVEILDRYGQVDQDALAQAFARRYALNTQRGYGDAAQLILLAMALGTPWHEAAAEAYGGMG